VRGGRGIVLLALAGWPAPAAAHLVSTGLGPIYDGVGHLLLTPQDLLPLVAMSLLAGLGGKRAARWTLALLPTVWILGGLAGLALPHELDWPWLGPIWALLTGALVSSGRRLRRGLLAAMAGAFALGHGLMNGSAMAAAGLGAKGVLGIGGAVFMLVSVGAALAVTFRRGWTLIAVRVVGSWICAAGLLMVGWLAR
jgi:urease accessory protein